MNLYAVCTQIKDPAERKDFVKVRKEALRKKIWNPLCEPAPACS